MYSVSLAICFSLWSFVGRMYGRLLRYGRLFLSYMYLCGN